MRASEDSGARIRAAASAFLARRHSGAATSEDERALDAWRAEDPAHEAAYAEAEALWQSLGGLGALAEAQLDAARAYGSRVQRRRETRRRAGLGLAAGFVLAILLAPSPWPVARHEHVRTGLGEWRTLWLGDGTTIDRNTNSELTVDTGWRHRTARLVRGEALFSVERSFLAPFAVEVGGGTIRDLGTRFGVRIEGEDVSVYVLGRRGRRRDRERGALGRVAAGASAAVPPVGKPPSRRARRCRRDGGLGQWPARHALAAARNCPGRALPRPFRANHARRDGAREMRDQRNRADQRSPERARDDRDRASGEAHAAGTRLFRPRGIVEARLSRQARAMNPSPARGRSNRGKRLRRGGWLRSSRVRVIPRLAPPL